MAEPSDAVVLRRLLPALQAVIDADSWSEVRQVIRDEPGLLSTHGMELISRLVQEHETIELFQEYGAILHGCRLVGPDVALAGFIAEESSPVPDEVAICLSLQSLLACDTWEEVEQALREEPMLLDRRARAAVRRLSVPDRARDALPAHALAAETERFLEECARSGADTAIARARAGEFILTPIDVGPLTAAFYTAAHAGSADELQRLIGALPDLLSDYVDDRLARAIAEPLGSDRRFEAKLVRTRFLLLRCREVSPAIALADAYDFTGTSADALAEAIAAIAEGQPAASWPVLLEDENAERRLASASAYARAAGDAEVSRRLARVRAAVAEGRLPKNEAAPRRHERMRAGAVEASAYPTVLEAFIAVPDWLTARSMLEHTPELLSGEIDALLASEVVRLAGDGTADALAMYLHLFRTCREEGIEHAFAELTSAAARQDQLLAEAQTALARYEATGDRVQLDRALEAQREQSRLAPWTYSLSDQADCELEVARLLLERYWSGGEGADLDEAAGLLRRLRSSPLLGGALNPAIVSYLGVVSAERYALTSAMDDLDEAIGAFEQTIATSDKPAQVLANRVNLAVALLDRYDRLGRSGDLACAIRELEEAIRTRPAQPDQGWKAEHNLGTALTSRYILDGNAEDLERAILIYEAALAGVADLPLSAAGTHSMLGVTLQLRYARSGRVDDLVRSVRAHQESVDRTSRNSLPMYLSNLGFALLDRFQATDEPADLDASIDAHRRAVQLTPEGAPTLPDRLNNLSAALMSRYHASHERDDLEETITARRRAVALGSAEGNAATRPLHLANLASSLLECHRLSGNWDDIDATVALAEEAAERSSASSVDSPRCFGYLANAFDERSSRLGSAEDEARATNAYRRSVREAGAPNPRLQLGFARQWGAFAVRRGSWSEAEEAYGHALELASASYAEQFLRTEKELSLGEQQGVASEAAYVLARTDRLAQAVETLENGQSVLLAEALMEDDAMLRELERLGRHELVARYRELSEQIAALRYDGAGAMTGGGRLTAAETARRARAVTVARHELDEVIEAMRKAAGRDVFGRMGMAEIREAVGSGALLYIATTRFGGVALLVTADEPLPVAWFNDMNYGELRALLVDGDRGFVPGILGDVEELHRVLPPLLQRLRATFGEPLARALSERGLSSIVIVPTGVMGLLPIHAVVSESGAPSADVIVSYAPSARALRHARSVRHSLAGRAPRFVGVSDPTGSLPFAALELEAARERFPQPRQTLFHGPGTRKADVLAALAGEVTHVHFSCHGIFEPHDPLSSGLVLAEHSRIRLDDLTHLPGEGLARLFVASACQTAITDFQSLPEEALGLPSALLEAGAAAVLGTLWPAEDAAAAILTSKFYAVLMDEASGPAEALQRAQVWMASARTPAVREHLEALLACLPDAGAESRSRFQGYGEHDRPFAHPIFWAPFVLIGE